MGRKKIQIQKIGDERTRHTTFSKRKVGLVKKAIELSVLCECDVLLIGFGAQQIFTYASRDLEGLLQEYKNYDGVCEMFDNGDLDSLKPGKITTGCTVVQRKQGVNIPISKREIRSATPDNGGNDFYAMHQIPHNMPMNQMPNALNHPMPTKPTFADMMTMNMPMGPNGGMMPAFNMMPQQHQQGNRKRKSLPGGGWMNGIGLNADFPNLAFGGNQGIAPLRTPPGPGAMPSFALAPPGGHNMKNSLSNPNPPMPSLMGLGGPEENKLNLDAIASATSSDMAEFQFSKKTKMNNSGLGFLMGDPTVDSDVHDGGFFSKSSLEPNWMNGPVVQQNGAPSFALSNTKTH